VVKEKECIIYYIKSEMINRILFVTCFEHLYLGFVNTYDTTVIYWETCNNKYNTV